MAKGWRAYDCFTPVTGSLRYREVMGTYPSNPQERARQLVAEGKLGGAKYGRMGGRPKVPRAGDLAAQQAAENAEKIVQTFLDALGPDQPIETRLRAAVEWLRIESREQKGRADDLRLDFSSSSSDEMIDVLVGKIMTLASSSSTPGRRGEIPAWTREPDEDAMWLA